MSKGLPYFRWYPADAEGDDFYVSLTDAEGWTYQRLLNRSWMNDGIPSNLDELARILGRTRAHMDRVWPKLSRKWVASPRDPSKLVNPRQEEEFQAAITKSENNKRPGNANAKGSRFKRDPNDPQRARVRADSGSVCGSSEKENAISLVSEIPEKLPTVAPSERFEEWWRLWVETKGSNHRIQAERAYFDTVTGENENACFACTSSYLSNLSDPRKGYNPENFLREQARDNFAARFDVRMKPTSERGLTVYDTPGMAL